MEQTRSSVVGGTTRFARQVASSAVVLRKGAVVGRVLSRLWGAIGVEGLYRNSHDLSIYL